MVQNREPINESTFFEQMFFDNSSKNTFGEKAVSSTNGVATGHAYTRQ
jgi:hypothetical protein